MIDVLKHTSEVFNEDCMVGMARYPDKHFDLAVVDPPYGIDLANMKMGVGNSPKCSKIQNRKWQNKDWDKAAPSIEYFNELRRISKDQIIWGGNYFPIPPCKRFLIWDKEIPKGLSFADCEMAWTSFDGAPKMFRFSTYKGKSTRFHPTQKPIELYSWIYGLCLPNGGKVIDTHLGSGSNRIAANKAGNIDFTGFELDKDYYEAQEKRWRGFINQTRLF